MKYKPNQSIKKGDCILEEKPFVFVLKSKYRTERCDLCFTAGKISKCSGCQYVYYCNRGCQKEAWPQHKFECKFLEKIFPRIVPDAARMISRIILRLKNNGDMEKSYYTEKEYRKFKDLMSHYQEIKEDDTRVEHFQSLTHVLYDMLGDQVLPNPVELLAIYGRLVVNGFNILDGEMNIVGTGLYLGVSVTDHRCHPNAVATFEGTTLYVRALVDMDRLDWSKIFISYIDIMNTPEDRRKELKANYYFLCTCEKCINTAEAIEMLYGQCPNLNCLEGIDMNKKFCLKCDEKISEEFMEEFNDVLEFTKMHLSNMKDVAYLDICKICLKKQANILHPLNVWHVKTLDMAFESAIDIGKWEEALEYGNKLLPGFTKYNGVNHPLLGLLYMKLGKIQLYLEKISEARNSLTAAEKILKITHGVNHSLYKGQLIPLLMQCNY